MASGSWPLSINLFQFESVEWDVISYSVQPKENGLLGNVTRSSYLIWIVLILTCTFLIIWVANFSTKESFTLSWSVSKKLYYNNNKFIEY